MEIVNNYEPASQSNPQLIVLDWKVIAIAVVIFLAVAVITKGRSIIWLGNIFTGGKFGGGRSRGGGAQRKWRTHRPFAEKPPQGSNPRIGTQPPDPSHSRLG